MGNTPNPYGKPVYSDGADHVADLQAAADFADVFANIRVGDAADRAALVSGELRAGMLFSETDTGLVWEYDGTDWDVLTNLSASYTSTASQSIATGGSNKDITFTGATPDVGSGMSATGGVITVGVAGRYLIYGQCTWSANATGSRFLLLSAGSSGQRSILPGNAVPVSNVIAMQVVLAASDTVKLQAFQNSGAGVNIGAESGAPTHLSVARIR